jgi:hypothetical protein
MDHSIHPTGVVFASLSKLAKFHKQLIENRLIVRIVLLFKVRHDRLQELFGGDPLELDLQPWASISFFTDQNVRRGDDG